MGLRSVTTCACTTVVLRPIAKLNDRPIAGYTLHADIALAYASSEDPSLSTYVRYVLLAFMECLCLERTALLIRKAADFIHDNNILGMVGTDQPSWLDFASRDPTEENAVATRQLATLVALVAHCFRFSQSSLQVLSKCLLACV